MELYDESLGQLDEFIKTRLEDPHPERSSALARGAETILEERLKRWPNATPPIAPNELDLSIDTGHGRLSPLANQRVVHICNLAYQAV